ncbi:MAG: polyhydroxyalkanoic acid system family protein [Xanthomonadales bacterium]|nr:polyhydroxyalkanoic acid system family protein [Xanthomonadales bacterium]
MSVIDITARHHMDLDAAQNAADDLARDLAEKFEIDYGWDGDFIHFERTGVDGSIEVSDQKIHVQARLGLLLMFLQKRIEDEIRHYLGSHFDCEIEDHSA